MLKLSARRLPLLRAVWILICILWICFIFFQSAQNATASSAASEGIRSSLNDLLSRLGFGFHFSSVLIRKLAHFTEYAILGTLLFFGVLLYPFFKSKPWYSALVGALIACTDEGIQFFSPGRHPHYLDVFIDFLGVSTAFWGLLFLYTTFKTHAYKKKSR